MTAVNPFKTATRQQLKLRMGLCGPSGSGKTWTALEVATVLADGGKVAVIDTEHGSARKYADRFGFDVVELSSYHPQAYIDLLALAAENGYSVIVVDSLSHAWEGEGGALEMAEKAGRRRGGNTFAGWADVTPVQQQLVKSMLSSPCHVIVTMRTKTEWVIEENDRGKKTPRKIGTAPVQRKGIEYEFDIVGDIDHEHWLNVTKSRCAALDGQMFERPGAEFAEKVASWLNEGEAAVAAVVSKHHASWAEDRARFCAALGNLGIKYEDAADWSGSLDRPRPSEMNSEGRRGMYAFLNGNGIQQFKAWLQQRDEYANAGQPKPEPDHNDMAPPDGHRLHGCDPGWLHARCTEAGEHWQRWDAETMDRAVAVFDESREVTT